MHGLILAGGEGARLSAEGIAIPKPLLEIGGAPLVVRLLDTLAGLGCETLTCMVRADSSAVLRTLANRHFGPPLSVHSCVTPSSLHTLALGFERIGPGTVFCTMVDTVMPNADWRAVYLGSERALAQGAEAVLAVTPFVDDESPLYVRRDQAGFVLDLSDDPLGAPCVTGGVYAFSEPARRFARESVERGVERTRGFLKAMAAGGRRVATITVSRIIDIDHASDLRLANAWLGSPGAHGADLGESERGA